MTYPIELIVILRTGQTISTPFENLDQAKAAHAHICRMVNMRADPEAAAKSRPVTWESSEGHACMVSAGDVIAAFTATEEKS